MKLKYHRLKPGGVQRELLVAVVMKLKYHRLKPGGVQRELLCGCSYEIEVPPAKAWCPEDVALSVLLKLKYHRLNQ